MVGSKNGKSVHVRLEGQFAFNSHGPIRDAAVAGLGIANRPSDQIATLIVAGKLVRVMADWSEDLPP